MKSHKKNYLKSICILSGGVDSTTLLHRMVYQFDKVIALSFDYGQRHRKELYFAKKTCQKLNIEHKIIKLSFFGEMKGSCLTEKTLKVPHGHYESSSMKLTVVPNRNSILLNIAIGFAISNQASVVGYGAHSGDHAIYPDCRPAFLYAIQNLAMVVHDSPVMIYAPFINYTKSQIIKEGKRRNVDYGLTWSCYEGGQVPCWKCGTCVERIEAFKLAQHIDPLWRKDEKIPRSKA